ncbi:hypothetical protein [Undibacterium crateris]|uniref:hypothetical protein n=1 Tax=Undibacterium crateris TaxID=2528175 RepID=UPI0013894991|nr:hypothetical protein [Undibacterium crateris]NDI85080.1 hypothetical protein [Undibacterium crateris]
MAPQIPATFVFCPSGHDSPILKIDEKGMTYKGTLIEDAGEAHKAFIEVMKLMRNGVHR